MNELNQRNLSGTNRSFSETIRARTQHLLQATSALKKIAGEHGTDAICSTATIGTALLAISKVATSGNLLSLAANTGLFLAGATRAYHIFSDIKSTRTQSELGELLRDVQAGIGALEMYGKMSEGTLAQLEQSLLSVENKANEIDAFVRQVQAASLHGREDLQMHQTEALKSYEASKTLYANARCHFLESQTLTQQSAACFESVQLKFEHIKQLVESQTGSLIERVNQLEQLAKSIEQECEQAKDYMDQAQGQLDKGIQEFDNASLVMSKAACVFGQLTEGSSAEFVALESLADELSKKNEESQQEISQMKLLLDDLKACHEDSRRILEEMQKDNEKAAQIDRGYTRGAVIAGGVLAGAMTGFGILPAIVGTVVGAQAFKNKETIARKVGDWAFSIPNPDDPETIAVEPYGVAVSFDRVSCGHFNRYVRRVKSQTTGTIRVNLGNESVNLRFDFRQKDPISKLDLCALQEKMSRILIENPEFALASSVTKILNTLETFEFDRGTQGKIIGIVEKDSPYFGRIHRFCAHLIADKGITEEQKGRLAEERAPVSLPVDIPAEPKKEVMPQQLSYLSSIGGTACESSKKLLAVALLVSEAVHLTRKHGTDALVSGSSVFQGLSLMMSGFSSGEALSFLTGAGLTIAGAKRCYDIIQDIRNPLSEETLFKLLGDTEANIDVLKTIGEAQSGVLYQMDKTLGSVEKLATEVGDSLKAIQEMAMDGNEEIQERQKGATGFYQQANKLFVSARAHYETSKVKMDASSEHFGIAVTKFKELSHLLQSKQHTSADQLIRFKQLAEEIDVACSKGKVSMDEARQTLEQGIQLSDQASSVMTQAAFEFGKLKERASEKFVAIENRAQTLSQKNAESLEEIRVMKGHIEEARANFEDSSQILTEMAQTNQKAQKQWHGYSTGALLVAGGLAAGFGVIPGAAISVVAAAVFNNKEYIAHKVGDYVFKTPLTNDPYKIPVSNFDVSFTLNNVSTGFFNRYVKKESSKTMGTVRIDLGDDQIATFTVNLNHENPLEKSDQQQLVHLMYEKLKTHPHYATNYLTILHKLEALQADRDGVAQKVIGNEGLFFRPLKRHCEGFIRDPNQIQALGIVQNKSALSYYFSENPKGWLFKQPSGNAGYLTLDLGLKKMTVNFDLDAPQKISNGDLRTIKNEMLANLKKDPQLAPRYLALLEELRSKTVLKKDQTSVQGFIAKHYPFIQDVEKICRAIPS